LAKIKEIPPQVPPKKTPQATKLLKVLKATGFRVEKIDLKETKKTEKEWQLIQPQFEDYFLDLFPQYRQHRITLEVFWTRYGTSVSFGTAPIKGKRADLKIFLRDDMGTEQIAEGFLSSLLAIKMKKDYQYSWVQRETIIDFLIQETKLNRLFPNYSPTLGVKKNTKELQDHCRRSAKYLKKLGFATKPGLSIHKNKLLVNSQMPKFTFSPTEEEILKRLATTPNEPVSYYDLGDLIWKDDVEKFSLWALSRLIFKIRNKLRKNGLSPEHVKNLRGRGYYYTSQP
jgi:DNA-binding winged helix-turn-helix (wHTH) protein